MIQKQRKPMKKLINQELFLAVIGFLSVLFLLWNRFIRVRLPQDMPLILTDLKFILLSFTCFMFIISLSIIINEYIYSFKASSNNVVNRVFTESLQIFDRKLKDINFIWINTEFIHLKILVYAHRYVNYSKYIFLLFHLAKIIVPFSLLIDIFYFHKLDIFYSLLPLLTLPLLYRYLYHSLHFFYSVRKYHINEILKVRIYEETEGEPLYYTISEDPIHYLIQETTLERIGVRDTKHMFHLTISDDYVKKNPNEDFNKIFYKAQDELTLLSNLYEILNRAHEVKTRYNIRINILMLVMYIICWIYALLTGNYALSEGFLNFIIIIRENIDPFSGTEL